MKSHCSVPVLVPVLLWLVPVLTAGPACGPCDPGQCAPLPVQGCPAGSLRDSCGCCSLCAAADGELCGGRGAGARRCGFGLECVRTRDGKKSKMGACSCKNNFEVCGTDGTTYRTGCELRTASLAAQTEGREPMRVQNKGRCATGETVHR